MRGAHLPQLVEGRAAAHLLRGQGGEAVPQRRSVRCTPVQHSAAWWAACWCCARRFRGCSGAAPQATASGTRHARRHAWPRQRQRSRSMSQPARRERRASWHIVCHAAVDGGQSHDCRSKSAGFVTPFTQSFLASLSLLLVFILFFLLRSGGGGGGRALTMGNYMSKVRGRLLAAWVVWGARLRRGPGAPLTRRGVGPTLTYRGEARTPAQFINSTHLLVPSPVQRRSGRLPPRPPGPLRVLELCFGTASAMAAPLWGLHRRGVSPAGLLIPFFFFF